MKIAIVASMKFSKEMVDTGKYLRELGHTTTLPVGVEKHIDNDSLKKRRIQIQKLKVI